MRKYFFRLETLLKVRKVREGRQAREVALAERKLSEWKEKEETLRHQIASLMGEIQQKRSSNEHGLQETYAQILDHLNTSLEQVTQTRAGQQRLVEEHKARLKQAVQERKVIEKIKEKHYAQWRDQAEAAAEEVDEAPLNTRRGP